MKLLVFVVSTLTLHLIVRAIKVSEINRSYEDSNAGVISTECTVQTRQDIMRTVKSAKCSPRETLTRLLPDSGYNVFPNMVTVKRCNGLCFQNLNCFPTVIKMKKIAVKSNLMDLFLTKNSKPTCQIVYVEEHTQCGCGCKVMKHHCKDDQVYNAKKCTCECKNEENMRACNAQANMMWDRSECKCSCTKKIEECSTGLEWVPSLCRCAKIMMQW